MNRTYNASIGKSRKYIIYEAFGYHVFEGSWDGFVQWLRDNPTRHDSVSYQTDDADVSEDSDGGRYVNRGFTDAEKDFIEETFGFLV